MTDKDLKDCPFCGGTPYFFGDASEWHDDHRYVQLTLKCCVEMTEAIGWRQARDMQPEARTAELQAKLTQQCNTRVTSNNYHPCTYILIEGLRNLPGGHKVLTDWDVARARIDQKIT